jgi:hypothetical protein
MLSSAGRERWSNSSLIASSSRLQTGILDLQPFAWYGQIERSLMEQDPVSMADEERFGLALMRFF